MISIENFKLLEDLKSDLKEKNVQLDLLKTSKSEVIHERAVSLLRRIQRYLENHNLSVENQDSERDLGFVANYKDGYIRGEVYIGGGTIKILLNGDNLAVFEVIPAPIKINVLGRDIPVNDVLTEKIQLAYTEIDNLNSIIKSYQEEKFVYGYRIEDSINPIGNEEKVLEKIFI